MLLLWMKLIYYSFMCSNDPIHNIITTINIATRNNTTIRVKLEEEARADVGYMPMTICTVLIQKIIDFKIESLSQKKKKKIHSR